MAEKHPIRFYRPYQVMFAVFLLLLTLAFSMGSFGEIVAGLHSIVISRTLLVTDFIALAGLPATLVNVVGVGLFSTLLMMLVRAKPNGAIIMAIWLNVGFAFFGKNVYNMLSLTLGVWLYSRVKGEPFISFSLVALLSATLSPIVSEISFAGWLPLFPSILLGNIVGMGVGFILPVISAAALRVHEGYQLYNVGLSGGLIAMMLALFFRSFGGEIQGNALWSTEYTLILAVMLYAIALALLLFALLYGEKNNRASYKDLLSKSGRAVSDYYLQYGESIFLNMSLLCTVSTSLVLLLRIPLNGPVVGGILTITGFGCFGKHLRNVLPVMAGAILCAWFNRFDFYGPANVLAILFSTGLAPIAGQFGPVSGLVAGFLHVTTATNIGVLNNGLNLYNNGFAGAFVALFLVPIIAAFARERK